MAVTLPLKARLLRPVARTLIAMERLWRAFWPGQVFVALWLAFAAFGLLAEVDWGARLVVLLIALAGAAWGVVGLVRRFRFPETADAERRLERAGGVPHRPFQALADAPISRDARGEAAWSVHVARMTEAIRRVRLGAPDFSLTRLDPWAARYGVLLLLIGGLAVGWGD
ncbi:MAG: DUF4175 family protein, partial [Alphaproteobacteria bacterium]